jgi:pimeloyl-ACP methyl ester carboxylesterase
MPYLKLNGHKTWVRLPKNSKEVVLLLHGGLSSSKSMLANVAPNLAGCFSAAAFDRRGHGRTADTSERFSYDAMADETIALIEHIGRPVHLVGFSDGGNTALAVALKSPDLVNRMVVIGANWNRNGLVPMVQFTPTSPGFAEWASHYGATSPDGVEHAKIVVAKAEELFAREPTWTLEQMASIQVPTLIVSGDDDVARLSHTVQLYEAMPNAQLCVIPAATHSVLKEHPKLSMKMINHFLRMPLPPVTLYPQRRK